MGMKKFSLADLSSLDQGVIAAAIDQELAAAVADCSDRPEVDKPRKVTLTIILTPSMDPRRDLGEVKVGFEIAGKKPVLESREYTMDHRTATDRATGRAQMHLVFNEDLLGDARTKTMPFDGAN